MEHYLAIHPTTHSTICAFSAATPFELHGDQPTIHDVVAPDSEAWLQLQELVLQGKDIVALRIPAQIKSECERTLNAANPKASNDPLYKFSDEIRRYHAKQERANEHLKPRTRKAHDLGRAYSTAALSHETKKKIADLAGRGWSKIKIAAMLGVSRSSVYRSITEVRS